MYLGQHFEYLGGSSVACLSLTILTSLFWEKGIPPLLNKGALQLSYCVSHHCNLDATTTCLRCAVNALTCTSATLLVLNQLHRSARQALQAMPQAVEADQISAAGKERQKKYAKEADSRLAVIWIILVQPLLFGAIGVEVCPTHLLQYLPVLGAVAAIAAAAAVPAPAAAAVSPCAACCCCCGIDSAASSPERGQAAASKQTGTECSRLSLSRSQLTACLAQINFHLIPGSVIVKTVIVLALGACLLMTQHASFCWAHCLLQRRCSLHGCRPSLLWEQLLRAQPCNSSSARAKQAGHHSQDEVCQAW